MLGDGWLGIWASPARFAAAVEEISAIAHDAGRDDAPSRHAMQVWCAFGEPDVARDRLARSMERLYRIPFDKFAATARRVGPPRRRVLGPNVDAGCRSFNLLTVGPDETTIDGAAEVRALLQD